MRIETPVGPARLTWVNPGTGVTVLGLLLLGHGAGGGIDAADLRAVSTAAAARGVRVGLVEQPYRVAGRRAPAPARQLDEAMRAVAGAVRNAELPLLLGGRSSGARVACRVAREVLAAGVLCLAFPLHPPGRPERSRLAELLDAGVPRLVVQGERDAFGGCAELRSAAQAATPPEVRQELQIACAAGADHALRRGLDVDVVTDWLAERFRTGMSRSL